MRWNQTHIYLEAKPNIQLVLYWNIIKLLNSLLSFISLAPLLSINTRCLTNCQFGLLLYQNIQQIKIDKCLIKDILFWNIHSAHTHTIEVKIWMVYIQNHKHIYKICCIISTMKLINTRLIFIETEEFYSISKGYKCLSYNKTYSKTNKWWARKINLACY